ncbi:MAG: exodeoxyribonuclease VII large subunit, partial [Bacilli bacterium]
WTGWKERPVLQSPLAMYEGQKEKIINMIARLQQAMMMQVQKQQALVQRYQASLHALSPYAVIERGYALTTTQSGQVVHSLKDVAIGDVITTQLKDGTFTSEVKKKG